MKKLLSSRIRILCVVAMTGLLFSCSDDSESTENNQPDARDTRTDADATHDDGDVADVGDEDATDVGDQDATDVGDADAADVTGDDASDTSDEDTRDAGDEDAADVADNTCVEDEDCAGVDEVCVDNACTEINVEESHFFAQIVDTTTDTDACGGEDPGSDIFGVELIKAFDGSTAYARALNAEILGDENLRGDFDLILDGIESGFNGVDCPNFSESFSLGCGGNVVVEFIDDAGNRLEIEDGDTVRVLEYGGSCGGSTDDFWSLSICDANVSRNTLVGDTAACNGTLMGDGAGVMDITVTL